MPAAPSSRANFAAASSKLRATPLRPFRLTAGPATSQLTVETITVPGTRLGIGLRAAVAWTPPERNGGPALRFDALAAGAVAPGGGVNGARWPRAARQVGGAALASALKPPKLYALRLPASITKRENFING